MTLQFSNFSTYDEAKNTLSIVEANILDIITLTQSNTSRITHDDPEVWRVWWQLGDIRVALHKIFPCVDGECFFHPHPWPSAVRILDGGYDHRIGIYNGDKSDVENLTPDTIQAFSDKLVPFNTTVTTGDVYYMPDIRQFHQVSTPNINYSLMIFGQPYFSGATKQFSRTSPINNTELDTHQIQEILGVAKRYYTQNHKKTLLL